MNTLVTQFRRTLGFATLLASTASATLFASEVIHWNRFAVEQTSAAMPDDPLSESRILAIVHLAMHDAANTVKPRFETYTTHEAEKDSASVEAAVAAAAHATLRELVPAQAQSFDAEFNRRIHAIADGSEKIRGTEVGKRVAHRLLGLRRNDGATNFRDRAPGTKPGEHRPTAPDFTPPLMSHWGEIPPFSLSSSHQFRPMPPPAPGSREAMADLKEIRAIGGIGSKQRTHEQSEVACYWYEHSTRGWNRIAREVASTRNLDVWEQARMLALVNVAMADGFIAGFEAKYHYYYWRPSTAIRESGETEWLSFLPTPPVPDYPSTHTVLGAAAATAIAKCLGSDYVSFAMTSGGPFPNITRRFWSLSQAAQENGSSRVLAGLHFTSAVQAGYRQGVEVGAWAAQKLLRARELDTKEQLTAGN